MLSIRSQMILSTHGVKDVGLPPASPSDAESLPTVSYFFLMSAKIMLKNAK